MRAAPTDQIADETDPATPYHPRTPTWRRALHIVTATAIASTAVMLAYFAGSSRSIASPWADVTAGIVAVLAAVTGMEIVVRRIIVSTTSAMRADLAQTRQELVDAHTAQHTEWIATVDELKTLATANMDEIRHIINRAYWRGRADQAVEDHGVIPLQRNGTSKANNRA